MTERIELPPVLDLVAAPGLLEIFLRRRGEALALEAGQVQRLGAQCLQVLLAARAAWASDHLALSLENPSAEFTAALELMGLTPDALATPAPAEHEETSQ